MAKIETTNEGRINASVTIDWKGKYELFEIETDETLETFIGKLQNKISSFRVNYLNQEGYYMFTLGTPSPTDSTKHTRKELSYIGKAFGQTLLQRIPQRNGHETAFQCIIQRGKGYTLYIGLGVITENTLQNHTDQLHDDIECCLIFNNQPTCNDTCKDAYNSELRREISITNTGSYQPLKENTLCE